jgi:hypothetical protein
MLLPKVVETLRVDGKCFSQSGLRWLLASQDSFEPLMQPWGAPFEIASRITLLQKV